jgi:zinc and cadmium transporter
MPILAVILTACLVISLGALAGVLVLVVREKNLERVLLFLVSLSAGALMGGAFFHLIPEAAEKFGHQDFYYLILLAFIFFFMVEKFLHWRHCHQGHCEAHTFGYMNLFGDSVHNFIDGLIIAATFLSDFKLGMATSLAVALHEIPQEIGDFGVLLYAGFSKKKALMVNFLVALVAILGGLIGYFLSFRIENLVRLLLPFAAGGFIYIAASDLIPEIRKETNLKKSLVSLLVFLIGVFLIFLVR